MDNPTPRNHFDRAAVRKHFEGASRTEQAHKKACDINSIMAKFQKTGAIQHLAKHPPKYGDVSGADFRQAQVLVAEHKSIFHELPSQIRAEFENDPSNYLDFVTDPENAEFLEKEGLAGLLPKDDENVDPEPPQGGSPNPEPPAPQPEPTE